MTYIKRKYSGNLPRIQFHGTIVPRKQATSCTYTNAWYQFTKFQYDASSFTPYHERSNVYDADGTLIGHSDIRSKDNIKGYSGGCALYDAVRNTGYEDVPRYNRYKCYYRIGYVLLPL